ncbi:MAG: M28 family peptidase [Planctomycetes bacterium]|nr:M28 family peptidase [Planctomycetota bacterium]
MAASALAAPRIEAHDVTVRLLPSEGKLDAEDRMLVLRDGGGVLRFSLNGGLSIATVTVDGRAVVPERGDGDDARRTWSISVPAGTSERATVTVGYSGPVRTAHIGEGLTFIGASSNWVPTGEGLTRFTIRTRPTPGTEILAQGARVAPEPGSATDAPTVWRSEFDTDGAALVAGPWTLTRRQIGNADIGLALHSGSDAQDANALIRRVGSVLRQMGELVGPYAGDRLDVVADDFDGAEDAVVGRTHGGPELMLLPVDVARRLTRPAEQGATSDRDERLLRRLVARRWWGHSVMSSDSDGVWCDALADVCADELTDRADPSAAPARAAERRRKAILGLAVRRADATTPDRAVLFLHALRRDIGDAAFWATLRRVAVERRGTRMDWAAWQTEFEVTSKRKLGDQFAQGLDRKGAPLLELAETKIRADGGRFLVTGVLRQRLAPGEKPWHLAVPIAIEHLEGTDESLIDLTGSDVAFSLTAPSLPLRVAVDPDHHVLRALGAEEIPACLAATLARPKVVVVVETRDEVEFLAADWKRGGLSVVLASDAPQQIERGTSYVLFGSVASNRVTRSLAEQLPRHGDPATASGAAAPVMALVSSRSPADASEFVTSIRSGAGPPDGLSLWSLELDGTATVDVTGNVTRSTAATPSRTSRLLLPETKSATSPERVRRVVDALASPELHGRLAGSPADAKARRIVMDELRLAGVEPDERPFTFSVKDIDPAAPVLRVVGADTAGTPVAGAVPLVASAETPEGGVSVIGSVDGDDPDLAGRALVVDLGAGVDRPLEFLRDVARVAVARNAAALFVRVPTAPSPGIADLTRFATLPAGAADSQIVNASDALRLAAVAAARAGSDRELPLPVIAVSADFRPSKDVVLRLDVRFTRHDVTSANVVGRIRARGVRRPGSVLLAAHLDSTDAVGSDGAATGAAALVETVNVLAVQDELLARDVLVVFFGASEWGLRGSLAFTDALPQDHGIVAMIGAEDVTAHRAGAVSVAGGRDRPRLARCVAAAIEQSVLDRGPDVALAPHGCDAATFAHRDVPSVSIRSADAYPSGLAPAPVDAANVARVGRALALSALAVAGGW